MIEAQIKKIDLDQRTVTIHTQDEQEITLSFPEGANIEVAEPETMGTIRGDLEDLKEGYFVEVDLGALDPNGRCNCASLVCIS